MMIKFHCKKTLQKIISDQSDKYIYIFNLAPHTVEASSVSVLPSFLPSFVLLCQIFIKYRSVLYDVQMLLNFVCHPGFKPATTGTVRQDSYPLDHGALYVI